MQNLYYGIGRKCINPIMPVSLAGYFNVRMWEGILDDIEVRALVLQQGGHYCAIVQFDLISVSHELLELFYNEIADIKELCRENMIITATHTHTAPEVRAVRPGSHKDYVPFAVRQGAEALREALTNMLPGEIFTGLTEDKRFCFNRRYWMKDGTVLTNPGKLNPDVVRPEGETDYEIPLIGIKQAGKLKVLLANIVNHSDTVDGCKVSADWPGFFIRQLQLELGDDSMVMPLIGAAGNINHFDISTDIGQSSYQEAERIGCGYANTVKNALKDLHQVAQFTLFIQSMEIACAPREISDDELTEAQNILEKYKDTPEPAKGTSLTSEDLVRKTPAVLKFFARTLVEMANNKESGKFNLVGIFLGECCILALPCEPFTEIGLELKKRIFPEYNAMVVSHANGTGSLKLPGVYIPNSCNYGRGGYETTPRSNPFSVKTADQLLAAWRKIKQNVTNKIYLAKVK
jgi:neutral ceramidase